MLRLPRHTRPFVAASAMLASAHTALAHDGHGLLGSHWHATDLWGFLAVGVLLAIAIWQGRK